VNIKQSTIFDLVKIIEPDVFRDHRGEYIETFNEDQYKEMCPKKFVVDDISISKKSVLRGLHGDYKTWKLIQCLYGSIYFVVVDWRPESPTYKMWEAFKVNDKNHIQILVPPGFVNGHLCLSDMCIFHYKQTEYYVVSGSANQISVKWDDPELKIDWLINSSYLSHLPFPILSKRDLHAL